MIRRPPRSTQSRSSAASDVYKRQYYYYYYHYYYYSTTTMQQSIPKCQRRCSNPFQSVKPEATVKPRRFQKTTQTLQAMWSIPKPCWPVQLYNYNPNQSTRRLDSGRLLRHPELEMETMQIQDVAVNTYDPLQSALTMQTELPRLCLAFIDSLLSSLKDLTHILHVPDNPKLHIFIDLPPVRGLQK